MGYRKYFAVVNKEKTEPFRRLGANYFAVEDEDECHRAFYQLVGEKFGQRESFCLGKPNLDMKNAEPFFYSEETQDMCAHYAPYVVNKYMMVDALEEMRKFVLNYYTDAKKHGAAHCIAAVTEKVNIWSSPYGVKPYNLSTMNPNIVNVMMTEYEIFELVRIYKSVDWEKEYVVYFGW